MRTTSGACVSRARVAAADGMPMPTKQTVPSFRRRAASMVMISVAVYSLVVVSGICRSFARGCHSCGFHEFRMVLRAEHVLLHPREERLALAGDRIPRLAERVVASVVAMRVAGMRAVRHVAH